MKRLTLTTAVLAILMAPAAFAQSTLNTTAPGASQETKPGQTNNNLQNPGSNHNQAPQTTGTTQPMQEPVAAPDSTTGTTTGTMNNTDSTTTTTPPATDNSTGAYTGSNTTSTSTSSTLPKTASDLPTVMMAGLLALFAAFALRFYSKRNA
jgi:hypothetical protein